jgi:hypothetical protein
MTGIWINGSLGFGMMLTMLFRSGDIAAATKENPSFPFISIFHHAVQSVSGAAAMTAFVMILSTCCAVGTLASSSRVFWAFSRDRGMPGWRTLSKVSYHLDCKKDNLLKKFLGQLSQLHSRQCRRGHHCHRLYSFIREHRLFHRFQWCHFRRYCRHLLQLLARGIAAALSSRHRRHHISQYLWKRSHPNKHGRQNPFLGPVAHPRSARYYQQCVRMRIPRLHILLHLLAIKQTCYAC